MALPCFHVPAVVAGLALVVLGAGCTEKLATVPRPSLDGCGGLFTIVALPDVPRAEQRQIEHAVPRLSAADVNRRLRRNFYRILWEEEGGHPSESRDAFAARMLAEEQAPPGLLAGVRLRGLAYAVPPDPTQVRAVRRAVLRAREPLARRLDRVAGRIAAAAGHDNVTFKLDARLRINAGAEVGFRSRRIVVGPSLILLAETDAALAFVLGHELAHVVHHHTKIKAAQDMFVNALTFGQGVGVTGEAIAGILSHGSMPAFNRDKECEADFHALEYMRRAGYSPAAAADLWRTLLALRPETPRQKIPFVSGRPPEAERALRLAYWTGVDLRAESRATSADVTSLADAPARDLTPEDAVESFGVVLD